MNKCIERIYNGIIKENPTFVLMLGMCPTLAVTTTATNGVGIFQPDHFRAAEDYSGPGKNPGIYRYRGIVSYYRSVAFAGICAESVQFAGYFHPADRGKLYHPGSCRGICGQERTTGVCF